MAFRVTAAGGKPEFSLSFDQIKGVGGVYERDNGDVLVIGKKGTTFVKDPANKSGYSRTGALLFDKSDNFAPRQLSCDNAPDGVHRWRKYAGTLTISG